ncbi:hypothetical protein KCP70_15535 [Salmonella enterica subsp. enterica]|nr:hypothetical protein KCP70_15535 [Salmonella enterica subsp. enterica]
MLVSLADSSRLPCSVPLRTRYAPPSFHHQFKRRSASPDGHHPPRLAKYL